MSTRDIHDQLNDIYGIEVSSEMVSKITDKILPQVKEWQSRPLNPVYPFAFMDCIHYKVREDGRILSRAANVVLGVSIEGYKEILSITVGANETSRFWLGMLNDLKNRGVKDVLFFCVDGFNGFKVSGGNCERILKNLRNCRKWGIKERRINTLCLEGRIEGLLSLETHGLFLKMRKDLRMKE